MGPATAAYYRRYAGEGAKRDIEEGVHIEIDQTFSAKLSDIVEQNKVVEFEGLLPGDTVFVEGLVSDHEAPEERHQIAYMCRRIFIGEKNLTSAESVQFLGAEAIEFHLISPYHDKIERPLGCYMVREDQVVISEAVLAERTDMFPYDLQESVTIIAELLDTMFSLMAETRLVEQKEVGNLRRRKIAKQAGITMKQVKRSDHRKLGFRVGARSQYGKSEPTGRKQAFHMRRAHWRRYDRQTTNGVQRRGRQGWWVWVSASWAGDVNLGVVSKDYKPMLDDPGSSTANVDAIKKMRA